MACCSTFGGSVGVLGKRTRIVELLRIGTAEMDVDVLFGANGTVPGTMVGVVVIPPCDCNEVVGVIATGRICRRNWAVGFANIVFPFPAFTTCIG